MPTTTVVLPYGGGPGTVVVPGADAVSHTELAALSGVYVPQPTGATPGYVLTVGSDGRTVTPAAAPSGGGSGVQSDGDGYYINSASAGVSSDSDGYYLIGS